MAKKAAFAQFNETVRKKKRNKDKSDSSINKENFQTKEAESSDDEVISSVKKRNRNTISSDEEVKVSLK